MERSRPIAETSSSREAAAYDYASLSGYPSSLSSYNQQVSFETQPINRDGHGGYYAGHLSKIYDKEALGPARDGIYRDYSYTSSHDEISRRYGYGSDRGSYLSEAYKGRNFDGSSDYHRESSYMSSASPRTSGFAQDVGSFGSRHHDFGDEHKTLNMYDDDLGSRKSILDSRGKPDAMAYGSSTVGVRGAFDYSSKDYNVHSEQSTRGHYALTEGSMTGTMRDDMSNYLLASKYETTPSGFHLPSSGASYDWMSAVGLQKAPAELGWKDFSSLSGIRHEQGTFDRAEGSSRFLDGSAYPESRGYGNLSVWNELDLGQKGYSDPDANGSRMADTKEASIPAQGVGLPKPANEGKKRQSRWEPVEENKKTGEDGIEKPKKKTRWAAEKSPVKETVVPNIVKELPVENAESIALKVRLVIISKMLQSGKVLDDRNTERSPSPEPVFDNFGFRINTREYRAREKLNKERQKIVAKLAENSIPLQLVVGKPKLSKKMYIPADKYPDYNFIGLIIGPRGHTQKKMEKESGARIFIRGKGSGKVGGSSTNALPSDNDNLHVVIEADSEDAIKKASEMVEKILVPVQDGQNELKKAQLRELASMNGTLRVNEVCHQCKEPGHIAKDCGSNLLKGGSKVGDNTASVVVDTSIDNEFDNTHLYVACLPSSVNDAQLVSLFSPFGQVLFAEVMKHPSTGLSKCSGFVKFADAADAAQAAALMNGYQVDGKVLEVKFKTKSNLAS